MKNLDSPKTQSRALHALRISGSLKFAYKACGVSEPTFRRYRQDHPEFDAQCLEAVQYWKVQNTLQYGARIREKALALLEKRIDDGSISDAALLKFLFERADGLS